jgi:hypothetical protein
VKDEGTCLVRGLLRGDVSCMRERRGCGGYRQLADQSPGLRRPRRRATCTSIPDGDASRAGQFCNSLGFLGVSSETYGTLTFFRQNTLTIDGVLAYDPMAGSYAFSPIGFSGTVAGGGDTENSRYSTAV